MVYSVKELFYTLQGEGAQAGRAAVFCRFAGCNLWSGLEADRATAQCKFCDTDFVGTDGIGGGKFATAHNLAHAIHDAWLKNNVTSQQAVTTVSLAIPYVVFTGGEPTLQLDDALVDALHELGFEVAIETNGTRVVPNGVDWVCVSPKAGCDVVQTTGHELKVVWPQTGLCLDTLRTLSFKHYFLQAMDVSDATLRLQNQQLTVDYCLRNPQWRLSVQTHKILGLP